MARIEEVYRERLQAAARARAAGRRVIGCLGADVPEELVMAAGFQPVRLTGDPEAATPKAGHYLGPMVDGDRRSQLELLLDGGYGDLDGLVIARDSENLVRLFYVLRALRKMSPEEVSKVAPFHFYDLLHMPHRTSGLYNRVRTRELRTLLATWAGREVTDAALREAITVCNENRRLLAQVRGRLSGVEALQLAITSRLMPKVEHNALLAYLLNGMPSRPPLAGKRVFVTGSGHDHTGFYELVEGCGAVIVGDDHEWGDRSFEGLVDETVPDPLDAIVDRYHFAPPIGSKYPVAERAAYTARKARETGAEAVIAYVKNGDPGPRWDVAAQREALGPIPLLLLDDQEYRMADPGAVRATVAAFLEGRA